MQGVRIGHGYDVHRLVEGRRLILGGVDVPWERGLLGHSDADVLTHAVMDALRPKLAPHIPQMRDNLARTMEVGPEQVNVKATTEEGLGFTGSGEGMAAHAVALIEKV